MDNIWRQIASSRKHWQYSQVGDLYKMYKTVFGTKIRGSTKNSMGSVVERENAAQRLVNMLWSKITEEQMIKKPTLRNRLRSFFTRKQNTNTKHYPSIKLLPNELELQIAKYLVHEHPRKLLARKIVAEIESELENLVTAEQFIAVDDVIEIFKNPDKHLTTAEVLRAGRAYIDIEHDSWTPETIRNVRREHIDAIKNFIETHDWDQIQQ